MLLSKKKKLNCLICLVCVALLSFAGCNTFTTNSQSSSSQPTSSSEIVSEKQDSSTIAESSSKEVSSSNTQMLVYDILGVSPKIQGVKWDAMQKMRDDAKVKATQYPQTVCLNDQPKNNRVYLTFDDGPDSKITPKVIQVLDQYKVKGNFFFLGNQIQKYPDIVKQTAQSGHYIGIHGYDHTRLSKLSNEQVLNQFTKTRKLIEELTGQQPQCIRPPYGDSNQNVINIYKENNIKIVIWSIDTLDWSLKEPNAIAQNVSDNLRAGDILLMHSSSGQQSTVDALPKIIETIQAKGYEIATLDKLE